MGLGVNSLDNINLLAFQVADSDRLVEKSLDSPSPSIVIGSSSISDVFVPSESTSPLQLLSKSLGEVMALKETGQITDLNTLKQLEEIKFREQTYKELLAKGESVDEVVALIQNDTKYINETVLDKVRISDNIQNQQNIIYQSYTGEANATWRQETSAARPEDIKQGILTKFKAEDQKLINLLQSNAVEDQEEALRILKNKEDALKSSRKLGLQSTLREENISSETKCNEELRYKLKTGMENGLKDAIEELQELTKIPASDLTRQQIERKEALEYEIQYRQNMMKKEGWLDDFLRNMNEADRKRLEEKAKDGTLGDEESNQILNRGLADSDKSGGIIRGSYTAGEEEFKKRMGLDKQSFYNTYNDRYQLDKVLKKEMALSLRQGTYSDASYYGSIDSKAASDRVEAQNLSTAQEERQEALINQGLLEPESETKRMLAEQYGLDPSGHKLLISYLLNNDIVNAFEYAQEHGMTSLEESLQESMNRLAFREVAINPTPDEFLGLSFA